MFYFVLNMPLETLTIFTIGSILMFDWVADTPLTYLEEEKNCEKPVKEFFFRNAAAKTKKQFLRNFWEKLY